MLLLSNSGWPNIFLFCRFRPIAVDGGKRVVVASHKVVRGGDSKFGISNVTVLYSDDSGSTWQSAEPELVVPSPNGGTGACEPTVIELMVVFQDNESGRTKQFVCVQACRPVDRQADRQTLKL